VCQFPGVDQNEGGDAVEVPALINDSDEDVHTNIVLELFSGPAPRRMKYVWFDLGAGLRLSAVRQDIRQRAGRVTGPIPIPNSKGFDFDSGFGFVDAAAALRLTAGL
jgi:hypothetical protein